MHKKGDTLIEVVLAIGIFSMVAISIVSVISGSSAGSQTNLEVTLARQEIDAQAEALRFIHASSVADQNSADSRFNALWQEIDKKAVDLTTKTESEQAEILQYSPATCDAAYDFPAGVEPFIINTRAIGDYIDNSSTTVLSSDKLVQTTTYPRLTFGDGGDSETSPNLYQAEGIYIIAVKDPSTTQLVDGSSSDIYGKASAYYDFYIRTCWYGIDANQASTISTVVRLHNPNLTETDVADDNSTIGMGAGNIIYKGQGGTFEGVEQYVETRCPADTCEITSKEPVKNQERPSNFLGWSTSATAEEPEYVAGDMFAPKELGTTTLYAVWEDWPMVVFDADGGSFSADDTTGKIVMYCEPHQYCEIPAATRAAINDVTRSGYEFVGWTPSVPAGSIDFRTTKQDITYKASWNERNEEIKVVLSWSGPDYDAHYVGYDSGGKKFHAYYGNLVVYDSVTNNRIAHINTDCRSGSCSEISTIYTLGGKDYTYYVHNFSYNSTISGATVTVKGQYTCPSTCTFKSSDATGSGRYWNVFSLINGRLVTNQYHSSVPTDV